MGHLAEFRSAFRLRRLRMFGLVDAYFAAARESQSSEASPPLFAYGGDWDVLLFEIAQGRGEVIAHEVELVTVTVLGVIFVRTMKCGFGGREGEDEPAVSGVDRGELKHIAEED